MKSFLTFVYSKTGFPMFPIAIASILFFRNNFSSQEQTEDFPLVPVIIIFLEEFSFKKISISLFILILLLLASFITSSFKSNPGLHATKLMFLKSISFFKVRLNFKFSFNLRSFFFTLVSYVIKG